MNRLTVTAGDQFFKPCQVKLMFGQRGDVAGDDPLPLPCVVFRNTVALPVLGWRGVEKHKLSLVVVHAG